MKSMFSLLFLGVSLTALAQEDLPKSVVWAKEALTHYKDLQQPIEGGITVQLKGHTTGGAECSLNISEKDDVGNQKLYYISVGKKASAYEAAEPDGYVYIGWFLPMEVGGLVKAVDTQVGGMGAMFTRVRGREICPDKTIVETIHVHTDIDFNFDSATATSSDMPTIQCLLDN